jgi:hypothetical protein
VRIREQSSAKHTFCGCLRVALLLLLLLPLPPPPPLLLSSA